MEHYYQPQYQLTLRLPQDAINGLVFHTDDLSYEVAQELSRNLIHLLEQTRRLTNSYPVSGDYLLLNRGDSGPTYATWVLAEGEMEEWRIIKRFFSPLLQAPVVLFEVRLARLGDEPAAAGGNVAAAGATGT